MKGLLRRIRPRRAAGPAPQETQPTMVAPAAPTPSEPLPAGVATEDAVPSQPSFRDRGRLRRRMRYLRRVRELGFRDLGGLVFDLHRFGRRADDLVRGKLTALDGIDRELRAIERALGDRRDIIELREPGIAACPHCGALHGSDARFCPSCGFQLRGPTAIGQIGEGPAPAPAGPPATGAPRPAAEPTPVSAALEQPAPAAPQGAADTSGDQPTQSLPPVPGPQGGGAPAGGHAPEEPNGGALRASDEAAAAHDRADR
jgi:zinc-ribbon domain